MTEGGDSEQSIVVVPDEVRDLGNYARNIAVAMRNALDSAASDVDTLTAGSWTGPRAVEFATAWAEIRDGGGRIFSALEAMAEKLGATVDDFQATDQSSASSLRIFGHGE
ncbi:WXG100 family type VII secretion target [Nocardia cyriacigeorgica]|uniref:WXG100 family type VII secretion target n=1 Tax=Nocardia cyriacigeorgica TaxID=135487 RepID=A0A6P1CT27_9NOCA|nr:WXG100 family type VII secretion target [Nocardia cyriacigeorgica]